MYYNSSYWEHECWCQLQLLFTKADLIVMLERKSRDHQNHLETSFGEHEAVYKPS